MRDDNPNIRALKLLRSFAPSYFPLLVLKSFFGRLSPYFNLYLSAEIVNEILGNLDRERLAMLVLATVLGNFAIAVTGGILNRAFGHSETLLNQREAAYENRKTLTLDYENLEKAEVRQLRRKIAESAMINSHGRGLLLLSVGRLANITASSVLALALGLEMFVLMFAAGFRWYLVLFVLVMAGLMVFRVWYSFRIQDKMSAVSRQVSQTMMEENRIGEAVDCYNMGKDVRIYHQDKMIKKLRDYAFDLHQEAFRAMASRRYVLGIPLTIAGTVLRALCYMFVCIYALSGVFGVGSIVKYAGFVETLTGCITSYFQVFADIRYNTPFVKDYLAYFDIPQKMQQGTIPVGKVCFGDGRDDGVGASNGDGKEWRTGHSKEYGKGNGASDNKGYGKEKEYAIEFRNVSFRYPGADAFALKNVSVRFQAGQRLAVVGRNGSGKTTFIKLMCRLYDPTEGQILLNGVDIREYDYQEYLSLFSVVFQDFKLFSFTLGQNVAASSAYDREKVRECLIKAGFGERLAAMPESVETCLFRDFEECGVEVSGGEAQKIALARALYRNAPFLVLDEPTAALDPISEYEVYSGFNEIAGEKTAVYISHRLASCRFCDRIAVFDQGEIVQLGTHESLLREEKGKYHELWQAQAQYYK